MSAVTAMWEWMPSWILTALNFGMTYPAGDEDDLFALGDDWNTAAAALRNLEPELKQVTAATQKFYTGEGAVQAEKEFGKLFSGDYSIEQTAKALEELGKYTRKGGTDIEHTKIMEAIFAGITVYSVYQLLASLPWGPAAVPVALGAGRTVLGITAEQGAKRLALEAGTVGLRNLLKPYLKQIAIAGLKMGAIGAGLDLTIQGGQALAGHRDGGIDLGQVLHTGVSWAAGGMVGAPVGMGVSRMLGSALNPTMRGLISGVVGGAAGGFGMYGAGIGHQVAEQWVQHGHVDWSKVDTKLQWQMVGAGAALGGMHGVRSAGAQAHAPTMGQDPAGTSSTAGTAGSKTPGVVTEATNAAGKQAFQGLSKQAHPDLQAPAERGRANSFYQEATAIKAEAEANGGYSDKQVARLNEMRQEWSERPPQDGSAPHPENAAQQADSGARVAPGDRGTTVAPPEAAPKAAPASDTVTKAPAQPERAAAPRDVTNNAPPPGEKSAPRAGAIDATVDPNANIVAGQQEQAVPTNHSGAGSETRVVPEQQPVDVAPEQKSAGVAPEQEPPVVAPEQESPVVTPEQEPPAVTPEQKSPAVTPDQKSPVVTPEQEPPAVTPEQKSPVITPDQKSPAVTPEQEPPAVTPEQKSPVITPDQEPPVVTPEQKSPVITPEQKSPVITPEQKSPVVTPDQKPPAVTPDQKSPAVAREQIPPVIASEQRAGIARPEQPVAPHRGPAGDAGQSRVVPQADPEPATSKEGTAANVGEFRGDARIGTDDLTLPTVHGEIEKYLPAIKPEEIRWAPEQQEFVLPDGRTIGIRVAERTLPDAVAAFVERPNGTGYDVEISPRARTRDVPRAVAHELEEIVAAENPVITTDPVTERPETLTSHLSGRHGEVGFLASQTTAGMVDPARVPGYRTDLADLLDRLGAREGPESPGRRLLESNLDPSVVRRLGLDDVAPDRPSTELSGTAPVRDPDHLAHDAGDPLMDTGRDPAVAEDPRALMEFHGDLFDAANAASAGSGRGELNEVQQFTLQRVMSRIFTQNPEAWMLKGGQSMLTRIPGARPTTDIDLVRLDGGGRAEMSADYRAALARNQGDHLRFKFESEQELDSGGLRMFHKAYIGDMEVMTVGIDLNPEREIPMWQRPEMIDFPAQLLRVDSMPPEPRLRIISVQDMLAHKVSGMYTEGYRTNDTKCDDCLLVRENLWACAKAGSHLPYRPQDMADVLLLALNSPFDGAATQRILRGEFEFRHNQGVTLNVPEEFKLPNPQWAGWFGQHLRSTDALPFRTLAETLPLAHEFLDPLLRPEDLHAQWDPAQRRWIGETEPPAARTSAPEVVEPEPVLDRPTTAPLDNVRRIEGTGQGEPSTLDVSPERMAEWDRLARGPEEPRSIGSYLDRLLANNRMTIEDKVYALHRELDTVGYAPEPITGLDSKHLRFYSHQSGEEFIHGMAMLVDPATTVEIAFQSWRAVSVSRLDAYQAQIAHLGPRPAGMTAEDANAVAYSRWVRGLPVHDIAPTELARELFDLHTRPLRAALEIRQRLIDDYGIDPNRIRLAHAAEGRDTTYTESGWLRAHLFTLSQLRDHPIEARRTIVDALVGDGPDGERRIERVQTVLDRFLDEHEGRDGGARKYTLLWVRDSRPYGQHGPELDTRPEYIRQTIETLRARQPDRQLVLTGDDLFARRPELRAAWDRAGVLDGVDTNSLIKFWKPDGLSRAEQALFFHRLTQSRNVVQVGMESGSLEVPAVLGTPTVYTSAREYEGNKANRWLHYSQPWEYGKTEPVTDERGNVPLDPLTGAPTVQFRPHGEQLPPPLSTIERVQVGPDLPNPENRRDQPVAIYRPSKVGLTADRITSLVESGELANWARRLGFSAPLRVQEWQPWSAQDWQGSKQYADQLNRWLHTEGRTPEAIADKWDAIRLALRGIVEPGFTADETYYGTSVTHPFFKLHTEHPAPAHLTERLDRAYAADPARRPAEVAGALEELFDAADVRGQAMADLSAFRLEPSELDNVVEAIDRVVARNAIRPVEPYDAPPGGAAWDAPGAATHSMKPPLERLWLPEYYRAHILGGDGTGGHRYGTGVPGKTEFPQRWDDATIERYLLEIAAAPDRALWQANGYWNVIGQRDGVTVTVIVRPDGRIRAGWPEFGEGVVRNPLP